jgi:hypothetical protein
MAVGFRPLRSESCRVSVSLVCPKSLGNGLSKSMYTFLFWRTAAPAPWGRYVDWIGYPDSDPVSRFDPTRSSPPAKEKRKSPCLLHVTRDLNCQPHHRKLWANSHSNLIWLWFFCALPIGSFQTVFDPRQWPFF